MLGDVDGRRFAAVVIAAAAAVVVADAVAAGGEFGGDDDDVEGGVGVGDGRSSFPGSDVGDDDGVYRLQPAPRQSTYSLCLQFPS